MQEEGGSHLSRPRTRPPWHLQLRKQRAPDWAPQVVVGGAGFAGSPAVRIGALPEGAETEDAVGPEEGDIVVCHGEDERETGA